MRALIDIYLRQRRARREITRGTAARIRSTLTTLAASHGDRPLEQLGRRAIERWLAHRAPSVKPATLRLEFSAVRTFCRWLVLDGRIRSDPTIGMRAPRVPRAVPRALAAGDVAACLAACTTSRDRAVIWLMVGLGLRRAEVAGLQVADVDMRARLVYVRGKGGHERIVPLIPEVRRALDAYLADAGAPAGPLIRSLDGRHDLEPGTIGMTTRRIMRRAGVRGSCHSFRHTCASDVADKVGDLRVVQDLLGHRSIATTQIYAPRARLVDLEQAMSGRDYQVPSLGGTSPGPYGASRP